MVEGGLAMAAGNGDKGWWHLWCRGRINAMATVHIVVVPLLQLVQSNMLIPIGCASVVLNARISQNAKQIHTNSFGAKQFVVRAQAKGQVAGLGWRSV